MTMRHLASLLVVLVAACGGSKAPIPVVVSPTPSSVLTCDTLQLTEVGGSGTGAWSVSPAGVGAVSSSGLYTAPTTAPASPAVSVTYSSSGTEGSAQLQVAEMFVGAAAQLPVIAATEKLAHDPLEHELSASGAQVYAGLVNSPSSGGSVDVYASADYGKTFTASSTYPTGSTICATVAADVGNPDVVYLVYMAGNPSPSGGVTLRLAVSTDGAKTFANEYDLAEALTSLASFICPDVVSPSAGHVVVTGFSNFVPDGSADHLAVWTAGNQGAGIGPATQVGVPATDAGCDCQLGTDTDPTPEPSCNIYSDGGNGGPRLVTNGQGNVCIVYQYGPCMDTTKSYNVAVKCSTDNGSTWSTPVLLGVPDTDNSAVPGGAMSPSGKIALAWVGTLTGNPGVDYATYTTVSTDGGKTFSTPAAYPVGVVGEPSSPVLLWENDSVLWLSQITTDNAEALYVDKSCDDATTWAGPVQVGGNGNTGAALVRTGKGILAVADSGTTVATTPLSGQ